MENDLKELIKLPLHEWKRFKYLKVYRVIGGFIYEINDTTTFVPLPNEMLKDENFEIHLALKGV